MAALFVWLSLTQVHKVSIPHYVNTELVFPVRIPLPPPRIRIPTPPPIVQLPPKLEIPRPKPETVHLTTPPMPLISAPATRVVAAPQQPKVGSFVSPTPIRANIRNTPTIMIGGFGDPLGVAANPNATRPATIGAVGSFENARGASEGVGTGTAARQGTMATGSFGGNGISHNAVAEIKLPQEHFTPPKVLAEPRPQYTEEAKQLKIQGEVTLQVRFGSDGKVEVLRVVTGLGHGLDEEAARVAERIQFKPAEKNGRPADDITYIHILFQLA